MNYSSANEKTSNITLQSLTQDEITEKYVSLKSQYDTISRQFEATQQELHDIKRNTQFSLELKEHLTSEVETLQRNENKLKSEWSIKAQSLHDEMEQLKEEKWKEAEQYKNTVDLLENQIAKLKENEIRHPLDKSVCQLDNTKISDEIRQYQDEVETIKSLLNVQKRELGDSVRANEMLKQDIGSLNEQVQCLKSNLNCKKEELMSVTDMLHAAQDDLCTVGAELQQFKNQTNIHAVKGNSLFAEVDDKRQEMLKSLSQMKDKVYQLNRELVSKQAEIDSLLCEKKALWEEYAGQANHHDGVLNRAYEKRITDLEKQSDLLHREIAHWYEKNLNPGSSEAAQWLSGVMAYYRDENIRLGGELTASSVDNLSKEQKLRELQRQSIVWRTKAMEANAAVSQLETKLRVAEKCLEMSADQNDSDVSAKVPAHHRSSLEETSFKHIEGFREINISVLKSEVKNDSMQIKKCVTANSGILVSDAGENKINKKHFSINFDCN